MTTTMGRAWRRWRSGAKRETWSYLGPLGQWLLPPEFAERAMEWPAFDRFHAKQGRSTARVLIEGPQGPVWGYLKRHERAGPIAGLLACFGAKGGLSPAAVECRRIVEARALGIDAPEPIAAGERLGPRARLRSYVLIAELTGRVALNEALPALAQRPDWEDVRRALARELALVVAALHGAGHYHKDLYLCHFFVDESRPTGRPALIDWQRAERRRIGGLRWLWKDLGQLLYSTFGVEGLSERDRWRFYAHYRKLCGLGWARTHGWMARAKAARYQRHNERKAIGG